MSKSNPSESNVSNAIERNINSYISLTEQTIEKSLDAVRDNLVRSIDEYTKVQPRFIQSITDFQVEAIQSSKNIINKTIAHQKGLMKEFVTVSQSKPNETYQQLFTKTSENVDNFAKAFSAGNQFNFDAIDNTRENLRLYTKAIDALTEYSTKTYDAWSAFAKSFLNSKQ